VQYIKFRRTGLTVSRLCLGTATFGMQSEEGVSHTILDKAAEAGVNFIDTADMYPMNEGAKLVGRTEEIIGQWLKGKRERFVVATKAGAPMGPQPWDKGASRKHLLDAIEGSLRRLGTDYVDILQLHFDDPETPLDETLAALDVIVRSGKARYIGVSNFLAYRLARAIGRADTLRLTRLVSVQPRYSLLFRQIERELLPLADEEGLAVIPFNPLAGGLLTGKYRHDEKPTQGRFSAEVGRFGALYQARYWHKREFDTIEELREISSDLGVPLAKLSIAWVLANPTITSAILGASRPDQLTDTLAAVDLKIDSALKTKLDEITHEYRWGDAAESPAILSKKPGEK
jgi:aryl-alcohol dehydrogenase-like predicted oxidoreductase